MAYHCKLDGVDASLHWTLEERKKFEKHTMGKIVSATFTIRDTDGKCPVNLFAKINGGTSSINEEFGANLKNVTPICVGGAAGSSVAAGLLAQPEGPVVSSTLFSASSGEQDSVEVVVAPPPQSDDLIQQREEKQRAEAKTEIIIPVAIEKEETIANAANLNPNAYLFDAARSVKVASAKADFFFRQAGIHYNTAASKPAEINCSFQTAEAKKEPVRCGLPSKNDLTSEKSHILLITWILLLLKLLLRLNRKSITKHLQIPSLRLRSLIMFLLEKGQLQILSAKSLRRFRLR